MPRARRHMVCLSKTPCSHFHSRRVRPAFLCGLGSHSGRSYWHRRVRLEDRLRVLRVLWSLFSIKLGSCAVVNNHDHLVLYRPPPEGRKFSG